jgi:hypothetical protein
MDKITQSQWEAYRIVQDMGDYNMFSPDARAATGLDKSTFLTIIKHYSELKQKFENQ